MMGPGVIQAMSDDAAYKAAQDNEEPLVPWKGDQLGSIPFLGDYVPKGWRTLRWDEVPGGMPHGGGFSASTSEDGPARWLVDSSGMGADDEPAMSASAFERYLQDLLTKEPRTFGVAVIEAGQFQVVTQLYLKDPAAPGTEVTEPDDWCVYCNSSVECYCTTCDGKLLDGDTCGANLTYDEDHGEGCSADLEARAEELEVTVDDLIAAQKAVAPSPGQLPLSL
jgi:hypothetical protein